MSKQSKHNTMDSLKIGLLYLSLHNQLSKNADRNKILSRKEFFCIIGKHFLIPKSLRYLIIKEMVVKKLIKEENNNIRILNTDLDLKKDTNKIYRMEGLF